jgi:hypothetical protein
VSNAVYPSQIRGLTQQVVKTPEDAVILQPSPSGVETRILQTQNPLWHWQLTYDVIFNDLSNAVYLPVSELQYLMGFFCARGSQFDSFLFDDPEDDSVVNQALQLVTDGTNYYTPLQRNLGGLFLEDVTDLNAQGDAQFFLLGGTHNQIFANGVQMSQSYSGNTGDFDLLGPGLAIPGFSSAGLYLKWHAAPTAPITGTFKFYFRVRFESSKQDFTKFLNSLYTIGGSEESRGDGLLKLMSARDSA